jgi:magnesium transporter
LAIPAVSVPVPRYRGIAICFLQELIRGENTTLSTVVKEVTCTHTAHVITYYHRTHESSSVRTTDELQNSWVSVVDPTEGELDELVRMDGLERDLLQDAIDPNEVPRVQHERDVTYFFLRAPSGAGDQAQTVPLLIAISPTFIVTVSRQPFMWLEHFIHGPASYSTEWRSQLVWKMLLELNSRYLAAINDMAKRVRVNIGPNQSVQNEDILRLVAYEGILNDFLAALQPMNAMLSNALAGKHMKLYDEDKDLMEDVLLGNNQVLESGKAQLRTTVNMREAYSVIATNDLNRVIKLLTLVTVVLTVPMVVSGLYGMNVHLPYGDHPMAFFFVLGATVVVISAMLRYLWIRKFL